MSINISTTEVVSDAREFKNISSASGKYDDLRTSVYTITTDVDFNNPIMTITMSSNITFTETNKSAGRSSILILDRSASGYTPTFSANVKWPNDTTPTWSSYRYWHIALVVWDNTIVRAAAIGRN